MYYRYYCLLSGNPRSPGSTCFLYRYTPGKKETNIEANIETNIETNIESNKDKYMQKQIWSGTYGGKAGVWEQTHIRERNWNTQSVGNQLKHLKNNWMGTGNKRHEQWAWETNIETNKETNIETNKETNMCEEEKTWQMAWRLWQRSVKAAKMPKKQLNGN